MRKINTVFIGVAFIAALLTITACKALFSDIEEDFSYWASEPIITGFRAASAVQPSDEGFQCVPSASDVELTLTVRNPKKFSFIMPDSLGAPTDIVTFGSDVHDSSKTNPPVYGTDYTLEQSAQDSLKLTYKEAFLKRYEWSSANIGAAIKLYSTDGRKFNQTYKFNLEANTPPPNPAPVEVSDDFHIALFKTATADSLGKRYYVLCFKVDYMPGENVISGVPLYGDIKSVCVSKNDGAEISYPITLNSGYTDFDISNPSNIAFIAKDDVAPLSSTEAAAFLSSLQPDNVPSASWTLYLKTDIEVGGATAKYGIRLFDGKLYSALSEQTIGKRALPTPKVFAHPDIDNVAVFGVYTEGSSIVSSGTAAKVNSNDLNGSGANNGSTATNAIPVYSAYGEAVKLMIKKNEATDYPAGVTVTGSAELVSGASISGTASFMAGQSAVVTLPSPTEAGGETVYKVTIQAKGEGFDDSATRTLYYKVRRELKTVNNLPVWYMLGAAIEKIPLGGAGTVKISGILKAESIGYPPHPDGSSVVNNSTIDVSGKKDSGDYPGRTVTVIGDNKTSSILDASNLCSVFNVEFNGKLILKNVTLQNAKNDDGGYGGGIYISDNGSSVEMTDTDITNCTVTAAPILGGAVYIREGGSLTVGSGCVISGNTAPGGKGGGIYVQSGGTFNIAGDAKIDENNDVYLKKNEDPPYDSSKNAKLTVTAPLTGMHTVAKITPEDYTAGVAAVNAASGVSLAEYAGRFKITDQTIISPLSTVPWKLIYNSNNTLVLKANVPITVDGTDPNAWKTLKEAIEAESVENGDKFIIQGTIKATSAPGNSGVITVRKNISIKKGGTSTPILNANSNGTDRPPTPHRIFTVENGGELTLDGIQLENGNAGTWKGGAILIKEGGKANITNTFIYGCKARNGGAIYNEGSLSLSLCHIGASGNPNEATSYGGAIYSYDKTTDSENCTILGTDISYNEATTGGGICIIGGKCTIGPKNATLTLIDHNMCSGSSTNVGGGGLYIGTSGVCTISGGTKISNNSSQNGGAFLIKSGSLYMENNCIVEQNKAKKGGGIYITDSSGSAEILYCHVRQNEAQDDGGGIFVAGGASCTLDGVKMQDNTVNNGKGSAVYVSKTVNKTPTLTLKGDVKIGTSDPNSNTICLGFSLRLPSNIVESAFVSATSTGLSDSSHINIEPENYIKQNKKNLIKGEGIGWKDNLFHLTNIPASKGSWNLTKSLGGNVNNDRLALERTSANLTASGTTGDWKALKETIESLPSNGGTLILNGIFKATSGDDSGEIIVRKVLTIDGGSSAVIDADNKCRIFNLQSPLTLKNITLENGNAGTGSGGAVYVSTGELEIEGSTRIVPSTGSDEDTPGKNDVYLKDGTMIDIKGALTGAAFVARITPEKYRSGTQVLDRDIISGTAQNYKKFKVTLVSTPQLYVGSNGKLTTTQP
ncbi:right-handed parallel beta-helix repeat-containing protein [Treponema sp. Marseille-Q3903]|uniref:right-handed parallel beta-helix repeat-containing protein n=1 Tax=Treponema sp. Marseille-Q3903 TaxID=2766703 RepID=UPI001652ACA8|nr:right-handed parallel beta-helix repeat-containing protein [Treponema sp. Marseille-Q3903]MBC6713937.1 hypothetical protein [Treponema sp. Marseille-Q3903]